MAYALQPTIQQHAPGGIANFRQLLVGVAAVSLGRNSGGMAGYVADAGEWLRACRSAGAEADATNVEDLGVVSVAG
jgi:hypothetical protein